jgi:DNA-binding NtrC family response regulator
MKTEPLDAWALQAWKNALSDIVTKSLSSHSALPPTLLAYTREPSWESASLALRVGAREITRLSKISDKVNEILRTPKLEAHELPPLPEVAISENVLKFPAASKISSENPVKESLAPWILSPKIPKHAIPFPIEGLEGSSQAIEVVRESIRRSAALDTPVFINGPTGSGKELVARCLHKYSPRASGPFIPVNCGALAPGVIESELFGHSKGSFTGAHSDRVGLLEAASAGTLFLDEITELPLEFQVKLLRAIQEKKITPVGSNKSIDIDFRLISASKDDVSELVEQNKFREDLLYRLRVIEVIFPSLSERKSDISEISNTLLKKIAKRHKKPVLKVKDNVLEKFLLYPWPGNVRELENALEQSSTLAWSDGRKELDIRDFADPIQLATMALPTDNLLKEAVKRFEREYIASTIRRFGGSKEQAADSLGLSLATLYRKLG